MLRRVGVAAAVVLCLLVPAAPASASGNDVIKDCVRNGRLSKQYSQQEYRSALANLPTDVDEYTDCRDIIRRAQLGFTPSNGGGGGTPPSASAPGTAPNPYDGTTPGEAAAAKRDIAAARKDSAAHKVGADVVTPGALAYKNFSAVSKLPTPLLVLAIMLAAAALGLGAYLVIARVRASRHSA